MAKAGGYKSLQEKNLARIERYVSRLKSLYSKAANCLVKLASDADFDGDGQFYFSDFPELEKEATKIVSDLATGMEQIITSGTSAEWKKGISDTDGEISKVLEIAGVESTKEINNHTAALKAFQKRKIGNGKTLSTKVWDLSNHQKIEVELARSIAEGEGAAKIATSMKRLLAEPDKLFRRVRNSKGVLRLSKNAKAYHPGAGTYRSSYKNALRLARTETNMAYRNAEQESYKDKPYVVGIEIKRSNHPYDCPVCEALAGEYPKDFKWSGWHPQCRCYMIPILMSDEEISAYTDAIINGEELDSSRSVNAVTDVPQGFREWIGANGDRISSAKSLPYFIEDNRGYVDKYMSAAGEGSKSTASAKQETDLEKADRLSAESFKDITDDSENRVLADTMDVTSEEQNRLYSIDGYIGTGNSFTLNSALRGGAQLTTQQQETVGMLDDVIDRNTLSDNTMLYRFTGRINFAVGDEFEEGMKRLLKYDEPFDFTQIRGVVIQDKGFTSTSLSTEKNVFGDRRFLLAIRAPKGTNAYVTTNFYESEAVLKRGQKMIIIGGRKGKVRLSWGEQDKIILDCVII